MKKPFGSQQHEENRDDDVVDVNEQAGHEEALYQRPSSEGDTSDGIGCRDCDAQ